MYKTYDTALLEIVKSGKDLENMDLSKGMSGISQKQMMKFAKKFGKKMRIKSRSTDRGWMI